MTSNKPPSCSPSAIAKRRYRFRKETGFETFHLDLDSAATPTALIKMGLIQPEAALERDLVEIALEDLVARKLCPNSGHQLLPEAASRSDNQAVDLEVQECSTEGQPLR